MYRRVGKPCLDFIGALLLLPFVCIEVLLVAPLIWLEDHGTIFYLAKRRGLHGRIFVMYKLRSMKMNAPDIRNPDNSTYNSESDSRVTKVGRFLRKTSLDEFPQVLNILKGDMSFIGPRPVTIDRPLEEYDQVRLDRLRVKPGITGYAQAYYRNSISQSEKLQLDAQYANNVTFMGDVRILIKTISTVLKRDSIYNKPNV